MQLCQAQCSKCFYRTVEMSRHTCHCYDGRSQGYQRYDYERSDRYGRYFYVQDDTYSQPLLYRDRNRMIEAYSDRLLCTDCNKMDDADLLALRKKRDRKTYAILTQQSLACAKCAEMLSRTGPLWWVCSTCSAECRSHDHPVWGRKLEV
jgi:hypothetical protein